MACADRSDGACVSRSDDACVSRSDDAVMGCARNDDGVPLAVMVYCSQ
jgi:hypothetical protein